jgi:hypothetical protein
MSSRVLQINFKFNVTRSQYEQAVAPLAAPIAAVQGLRWKVWIMNEQESEAGGIYLFQDEAAANAYLGGAIVAQVVSHPALHSFSVKQFDVMEEITEVTRGPV